MRLHVTYSFTLEAYVLATADIGTVLQRCHTFQGTPPLFAPVNAAQPN